MCVLFTVVKSMADAFQLILMSLLVTLSLSTSIISSIVAPSNWQTVTSKLISVPSSEIVASDSYIELQKRSYTSSSFSKVKNIYA